MHVLNTAVVAALTAIAGTADAVIIDISAGDQTVADLLGNSFVVDDKLFEINFYASTTVDPSELFFVPVDFGLAGRGFDLLFGLADPPGDAAVTGFTLEYDVTVINPNDNFLIVDNILQFNGFASGPGSIAEVNETVIDNTDGSLIGEKTVFAEGALPMGDWVLEDRLVFGGRRSLNIVKDFLLFAPNPSDVADASFIRQTFSQVPTPASLGLLAGACVLAGCSRRRAE
ncbi:MAG: hypothetical protein AAGI30_02855 [Planctomycetota bacterium]